MPLRLAIVRTIEIDGREYEVQVLLEEDLNKLAAKKPFNGRIKKFLAEAERDIRQRTITLT